MGGVNLQRKIKNIVLSLFVGFKSLFSPPNNETNKKRIIFFKIIFSFLAITIFITVLFQAPVFVDKGLNNIELVLWAVMLILVVAFDWKSFLLSFLK